MLKIYNETQLWKIHFKPEYFPQLYLSTPIASIVAETCNGRCNAALDNTKPCQCNSACVNYGDCCPDYQSLCNGKLFIFFPIVLKGIFLQRGQDFLFINNTKKANGYIQSASAGNKLNQLAPFPFKLSFRRKEEEAQVPKKNEEAA